MDTDSIKNTTVIFQKNTLVHSRGFGCKRFGIEASADFLRPCHRRTRWKDPYHDVNKM